MYRLVNFNDLPIGTVFFRSENSKPVGRRAQKIKDGVARLEGSGRPEFRVTANEPMIPTCGTCGVAMKQRDIAEGYCDECVLAQTDWE